MSWTSLLRDKDGLYPPSIWGKIVKFHNLPKKALETWNLQSLLIVTNGYMSDKLKISTDIIDSLGSSLVPKEIKEKFVGKMKTIWNVGINNEGVTSSMMKDISIKLRKQGMDIVNIWVITNRVEIKQEDISLMLDELSKKFKVWSDIMTQELHNDYFELWGINLSFLVNSYQTTYAPKEAFVEYSKDLDKWMYENKVSFDDIKAQQNEVIPLSSMVDDTIFVSEHENVEIAKLEKRRKEIEEEYATIHADLKDNPYISDAQILEIENSKKAPDNDYQREYWTLHNEMAKIKTDLIRLKKGEVSITDINNMDVS